MCRYARPYKQHFACFGCRKMFRQPPLDELAVPLPTGAERVVSCPECGERMHNLGLDFKAPKQRDVEQWEKVRLLHAHGIRFNSCGCGGPGHRPARLREVPAFLDRVLPQSRGEWLLRRLTAAQPKFRTGRMPHGLVRGEHPLGTSEDELRRRIDYSGSGVPEFRKKKAQRQKSAPRPGREPRC